MPTVIAIASRKGGVGKTTLAVSLAAAAACASVTARKRSRGGEALPRGNGPILVDADSQGNATTWGLGTLARTTIARAQSIAMLAFPPAREWLPASSPLRSITTREELLDGVLPDVLKDSVVPGLRVVGSTPMSHPEDSEEIVLRSLPADVVIVDTGADTSTPIVRSVLRQSDAVIVPVVPEPWSVDGIVEVLEEIQSTGRSDLLRSGGIRIVVSRRERNKVHDILEHTLRERFGELVSRTVVPKSAAIALVSHKADNLRPGHALAKIGTALLREILDVVETKGAAA
jgi:cellulose biosynthesis protein BcsQ